MQLLKLTSSYNASKGAGKKQNSKNHYLNILENCLHVPKDDKLILRKSLTNLKSFDENNEIVAILNSHSLKGKQEKDKKLDVLLRKLAQNLRKNQLSQMVASKTVETKAKANLSMRQPAACIKGNYNNFNLMMQTLRSVSNPKSQRKSQSREIKETQRSLDRQKYISQNVSTKKYQSLKKGKKNQKTNHTAFNHSFATSRKAKYLGNQQFRKSSNTKNENKQCQTQSQFQLNFYNSQASRKTHKYSRSRSLKDLIINGSKQIQDINKINSFESFNVVKSDKFQSCQQQTDIEKQPLTNLSQLNLENSFSNLPISNINLLNQSMTSLFSVRQYSSKSVHSELKEVKIISQDLFDYFIPLESKQSRSPGNLSIPYHMFIDKLNQYISTYHGDKSNVTCSYDSVYIPFHTQYDLVTFQKLVQFLEEYTCPKYQNNPVRDLYTRIQIGVCGLSHMVSTHKRINIAQFKSFFEWKNQKVHTKFENMAKRCNRWGSFLTYWQMYWLKDCEQYQQFFEEFNQK